MVSRNEFSFLDTNPKSLPEVASQHAMQAGEFQNPKQIQMIKILMFKTLEH